MNIISRNFKHEDGKFLNKLIFLQSTPDHPKGGARKGNLVMCTKAPHKQNKTKKKKPAA